MSIPTSIVTSVRLNQNNRRLLTNCIVDAALRDEKIRMLKVNSDMAHDLYNHKYSADEREFMANAPAGMFHTIIQIQGHVTDAHIREQFSFIRVPEGEESPYFDLTYIKMPVWADMNVRYDNAVVYVEKGSLLGDMITDYERWSDDHRQKRNEMVAQVGSFIDKMPSTKKLAEEWPESIPYIIKMKLAPPGEGKQNLALRTSDLNKFLGLPI